MRLGRRLADAERSPGPFGNEAQSVMDVWRGLVMTHLKLGLRSHPCLTCHAVAFDNP